ncbi:histidine kinase [Asanoa sp. WMMD1127]|uniref:sensor histidine kinase n=1 Tax=Asanoa sp. WMMD1127 TaxID=3016107 RepID=UPI0024174596|nr:histidine kinase [Asanoa sp. WMMD1127]MDG4825314.1 histidine kinase [Asanoa sp. WMMD1127]
MVVRRVDVVVAVVFVTIGLAEELSAPERLSWWWARLGFAAALVLLRRAAPLGTLVVDVVVLQTLLMPVSIDNYRVWQAFCILVGMHTIGREIILSGPDRDPLWRRLGAVAVVAGSVVFLVFQDMAMRSDYVATVGYLLAAWVSGLLLQIQARRIAERNAAVATAAALRFRETLADERARIARELHDIVAHSVTVMVLQAGVVRRRLDPAQQAERDLLAGVEDAGRDAVAELRRTLGLLRGGAGPGLDAQPGLGRLDDLVAQLAEAGVAVRVTVDGGPIPALPPSLDLSAYRIVQEALTNVLKHSGADRAEVAIAHGPDVLSVTVTDAGDGQAAAGPAGAGHGIVGMRERAAMFGGTLAAEPLPGGGFRVTAVLPVPARTAVARAAAVTA